MLEGQLTASTLTLLRGRVMATEEGTWMRAGGRLGHLRLEPSMRVGPLLREHHSRTEEGQGGGRQMVRVRCNACHDVAGEGADTGAARSVNLLRRG